MGQMQEIFMERYDRLLYWIAELTVRSLELVGILIIAVGSFVALAHLFTDDKHKHNIIIDLGKMLALALEFKMGAEIVNTVIVRDITELGVLAVVIALRALLSLLIHWEIKNEKRAELGEAGTKKEANEP